MRTKAFCQGALLGFLACFLFAVSCYGVPAGQDSSGLIVTTNIKSHNGEFRDDAVHDEGKFNKPLIPIFKKPLPPLVPIFKKPLPPLTPISDKPLPPPVPVFEKPLPPPIPILKKPPPPPIPISKKPSPPPVPVVKKSPPPLVPIFKKRSPPPVPFLKKPPPPPIPIFEKPLPPPVPIFEKPIPPPVPIYEKPLPPPVPIFEKPIPPPVPIYEKPLPPPVPIFEKPIPPPFPIYEKPLPPPVPIYEKPIPPPVPIYKKPLPPPVPIYDKPIPPPVPKAMILWTQDPPERDAKLAKDELKTKKEGIKHLQVIVEIACASSPHHLMAVRQAYCSLFDCSLEEDIVSTVSPPLRKLLLGLVSSYRYDKELVDNMITKSEAATLHEAIKTKQLDHDEVVLIFSTRNVFQLRATFDYYKLHYGKPIDEDIMSCGKGDLESLLKLVIWCIHFPEKHFAEKAMILWTQDPPERDAKLAKDELKTKKEGIKHLQVIVEIACASSPHHLMAVRQAYCSLFDCSLEEDIVSTVSPPLRKLLLGLVSSYRYDKELVDNMITKSEAATLHEAIKTKQLDHDEVVLILSTRNVFQLRATFDYYKLHYGKPIDEDIMSCGKGDLESLLKVVIWCIHFPEKHFAEVIRDSIMGLGTDEDSLTRAIVTRAEIDTMKIRGEYNMMYNDSLDNAVTGDTSGDYRNFLMTLLGAKI
ncbi:annexin d3 [Quercus suber]|uniref:Annexin n=1 Tax=Quercus suber TaxID=58331 RepID=A0AAW0LBX3_QUESU